MRSAKETLSCPHRDLVAGFCRAAASPLPLDSQRLKYYCNGENHGNCVLFLAMALRPSLSLPFDRTDRERCFK